MDKIENLQKYFQEFGCTVEDNRVLEKCIQLCDLYDVDEEKLVEMWLGYSTSTYNEVDITLNRLVKMEHDLLKKQDQSNSINKTGEFSNARSVIESSYEQMIETDSILEMYGCEGVTASKTTMNKRLRSPDLLENEDTKIRAVDAQFFPLCYTPRSDTSVRCRVNPDSGRAMLLFGEDISSWNRESNYDVNIIPIDTNIPPNISYMYELLQSQENIMSCVCYNIGKRLCNIWSRKSEYINIFYTKDVTYQSQTNFRTWGRILCDADTKSDVTSYMLEGCKWSYDGYKPTAISLNFDGVKQYSLYPGQIVAVEGTNPTNSIFNVNQFFTKGYATKSEPPQLTQNLIIMVAVGPFTSSDNLCYQPLFNIMERAAKEEPHILILIGPFIDKNHPHVKNPNLMETFQEFFERLLIKVMQYLLGKSVKLVIIPSHLDVHHFAVFPTPQFLINKDKLPQNGDYLYMMPDPSIMNIEGLIIGATSVDSIKHISKEEISNFPATDSRLIRIADHILSQRCFYPFYPPSVNLDTRMWRKYAFFKLQPHILILPSDMCYFCGVINDCLVLNPERLIKQMYARLCIRPSEQWNPHNVSCEIGKV